MLFADADEELVKTWVSKKLEDVSDADADVLADYVLALIKTDEPEASAKTSCTENLKDFLGDGAESFVRDLFAALASRSYDPSRRPPKPALTPYKPPRRASFDPPPQRHGSKKRSYHDWDRDDPQAGGYDAHADDRPVKQARRGGRALERGGWRQHMPQPPTPPPGMPAFDLSNPLASLHAMYQAMGMLPPGFPAPPAMPPMARGLGHNRCIDYDTKGFCTRGAHCPYEHGEDPHIIKPDVSYDPNNPTLIDVQPTRTGIVSATSSTPKRGAHRGRINHAARRAVISQYGPNSDRSITSIVVEQIPEDKHNEQSVRDFFGEFGNINQVTLQPYRQVAIVRFSSYDAANAAYQSPKVIFDNRFVKVYWHTGNNVPRPESSKHQNGDHTEMVEEEPQIDLEEIAQRQEEAQRRFEEKKRQYEEDQKKRDDINQRLQEIETEKKALTIKMAKSSNQPSDNAPPSDGAEANEHTKALREQLAKLEEEAKTLGIDPNAAISEWGGPPQYSYRGRGRGAGGFRGRYRGRGAYNMSYRGGWGGTAVRGGAVKRLDNRPKTVCVAFAEGAYGDYEEALRSYLLFNASESASLMKHPRRADAALVAFPVRYLAENFWGASASPTFPVQNIELSWWSQQLPNTTNGATSSEADVQMEPPSETSLVTDVKDDEPAEPRDLDVADDDDRWG